jgi:hypothetical protein
MALCRSCGRAILWGVTEKNGKRIPLNADPVTGQAEEVPEGNLLIVGTVAGSPVVRVSEAGTHVSHFWDCPNAKTHRAGAKR